MAAQAQVLISNADLPTLAADRSAQRNDGADAVAIKDGKILAIGPSQQLEGLAGSSTRRIDAEGGALLPGINDAHLHFSALASVKYGSIDISAPHCSTWDAVAVSIREAAASKPAVIKAHGWDEFRLGPGGAEMLENLNVEIPIVLFDQTGHQLLANKLLVNAAQISESTPDPAGGIIGRDDRGHPNGLFVDAAMGLVLQAVPQTTQHQMQQMQLQCQCWLHSLGITSLTEPGLGPGGLGLLDGTATEGAFEALISLAETDQLTLRTQVLLLFSGTGGVSAEATKRGLASNLPGKLSGRNIDPQLLRIAGVKVFADGTPRSGTAWMTAPYGSDCSCGSMVVSGPTEAARIAELHEIVGAINAAGLQAGIHATGDATTNAAIDAITAAQQATTSGTGQALRHYIIHGAFDGADAPRQLQRMAAQNIGYCTNPLIRYNAGAALEKLLGPERFARHQPLASAQATNVKFTATSDAPVATPDWRAEIVAMVTRTTRDHQQAVNPAERINSRTALAAMTTHPAWQDHAETYKGSIAAGQVADLCLLEHKWPEEDQISDLLSNAVRHTWQGGRLVHGQY